MIEVSMYVGTGFLLASLSILALLPLVHNRAVRLTTRRLEGCIPSSMAEILADKDLLRAEFSVSTRRFEAEIERLKTKNARQLAELGRKDDAINSLKHELGALREEMRPNQEELAIKAAAFQQAKRTLASTESELGWRMEELAESLALADKRKTEIESLRVEVEALKQGVQGARDELNSAQHRHYAAAQKAECALAEKESELANRKDELAQMSAVAESRSVEIVALRTEREELERQLNDVKHELNAADDRYNAATERAERILAENEAELAKRTDELAESTSLAEARKDEAIALKRELNALEERLNGAAKQLKAAEHRHYAAAQEAQRALSDKEAEIAGRTQELAERTASAERLANENVKLKTEIKSLQELLNGAKTELKVLSDIRDAERSAAMQRLMEARDKFEAFRCRVAELVEQVTLQSSEDKVAAGRAQELEEQLSTQMRVLAEREAELERLSREIEMARQAEADLRAVITKIESHENAATQTLTAEKAKFQAALERANGERVRLAYELADLRRRLTREGPSAQNESSPRNGDTAEADRAA
jgi:chromosome segregation ATPase